MSKPILKLSIRLESAWRAWFAERSKSEPDESALQEKWQAVYALMLELEDLEANAHYAKHALRYITALRTPEATPSEINLGVKNVMEMATSPKRNESSDLLTFAAQQAWKQANAAWILDGASNE